MASAASANGSTHSLSAGPATPGNSSGGGGMEELLPLVLQLTNAESVSAALCCIVLCYVVLRCVLTVKLCTRNSNFLCSSLNFRA